MSNRTLKMTDTVYQYILAEGLREPDILAELRDATATDPSSQMQIAPEQGQLMQLLVKFINAKRILEIGTYTGYSALTMALALPEDGKLVSCDINQQWTDIGRTFWKRAGVDEIIELHIQPALRTLAQLQKAISKGSVLHFDLVFIDADKENYSAYYEASLSLLRPGGLIIIDNTLWSGAVADPKNQDTETIAIRALNRTVHQDSRVDSVLLPVADGLTLVRKI